MRTRGGNTRGGTGRGGTNRNGTSQGGNYGGRGHFNGNNNQQTGRRPGRIILVPPEFQRQTLVAERVRLTDLWKNETGCEVKPLPDHVPGKFVITSFEIYGTGSNLDQAVEKVEEWIRYAVTKTSETTAWAKISAYDQKNWISEYTQREQDERKKKFLKEMPDDEATIYKSLIMVPWPKELREAGVTMKDVFGTGLMKLDSIRTGDEVFIKAVGLQRLEIRGSDITRARSAEQHVKVLIEKAQIKMNNSIAYPKYIILDQRESSEDGVIYERAETWWPDHLTHPVAPRLLHDMMMGSSPDEYWQDLGPDQCYGIQSEIQRVLDNARYEKGSYELSIRLGCFAIKADVASLGTKHKTEEFLKDIVNRKDGGCAIKHWLLHNQGGEALLARLVEANHLLEPTTHGSEFGFGNKPETLVETTWYPRLRGTWVFKDPNISQSALTNYVVQVYWSMDEDGLYEKEHTRFYRLEPGRRVPKDNVDIKLLELGESKGWQISLTSMTPITKGIVPTALRGFADQVKVKARYGTASKECFVDFKISPSSRILTGRLDKIYTFGLKKTNYKVDVVSMWYPGKNDPCWGLNVYHSEWRTHLARLEQLRPGECAAWGNTVSTFLPDDGSSSATWTTRDEPPQLDKDGKPIPRDGIRLLLVKLMELSQVVFQNSGAGSPDVPAIPPTPTTPSLI